MSVNLWSSSQATSIMRLQSTQSSLVTWREYKCASAVRERRIKLEPMYFSVLFILPLWPSHSAQARGIERVNIFVILNYLQSGGHNSEQFKLLSVKSV